MAPKKNTNTKVPKEAEKKENVRVPEQQDNSRPQHKVPYISARIDRMNDDPNSNFKANASVTIGNHFAVHGFTVYENEKGRSVLYPGQKGSDKNFYETFHPVTKEAREALNGYILDAYEQKLEQTEGQNQGEPTEEEPSDDEEPAFEQTM